MAFSHDTSAGIDPTASAHGAAPGLPGRVRGLLLHPKNEWLLVARESTSSGRLFAGYVMPLAALAVLAVLLRFWLVTRVSLPRALLMITLTFSFEVVGVCIVALIINSLASFFGGVRNQVQALKVATYAFTPLWLSCVFIPFPSVSLPAQFVGGVYHTYLLYLGLWVLMRSPRDRALGYATTVVLCSILLGIVFTQVGSGLGETLHVSDFRAFG
jgi:ABC-type Fe3+-siderophore transport system permease subunit